MRRTLRQPYRQFFGTMANQTRLDIIESLRSGPKNVRQIATDTGLEQSLLSHNLKRLETCGFVKSEFEGREKICILNEETVVPLITLMNAHMDNHCKHVVEDKKCH